VSCGLALPERDPDDALDVRRDECPHHLVDGFGVAVGRVVVADVHDHEIAEIRAALTDDLENAQRDVLVGEAPRLDDPAARIGVEHEAEPLAQDRTLVGRPQEDRADGVGDHRHARRVRRRDGRRRRRGGCRPRQGERRRHARQRGGRRMAA
jgi:hypothetical protein